MFGVVVKSRVGNKRRRRRRVHWMKKELLQVTIIIAYCRRRRKEDIVECNCKEGMLNCIITLNDMQKWTRAMFCNGTDREKAQFAPDQGRLSS